MKPVLLVLTVVYIVQVQCGFKFVCEMCAKDNAMVGFENETDFLAHSEWHAQQGIEARNQLAEDQRIQQEKDDAAPKLFHCHHCQYVKSFKTSGEFIAHVESEHYQTTIEENTMFIPQGRYKVKGAKGPAIGVPPDLNGLGGGYGGGGEFGGGGGGGMLDGMGR